MKVCVGAKFESQIHTIAQIRTRKFEHAAEAVILIAKGRFSVFRPFPIKKPPGAEPKKPVS